MLKPKRQQKESRRIRASFAEFCRRHKMRVPRKWSGPGGDMEIYGAHHVLPQEEFNRAEVPDSL
jgi:hypothetical protein